jgi:hypothetical protein
MKIQRAFYVLLIFPLLVMTTAACDSSKRELSEPTLNDYHSPTPTQQPVFNTPEHVGDYGKLIQNCIPVQSSIPASISLTGYLLVDFSTPSQDGNHDIYAININKSERKFYISNDVPLNYLPSTFALSPSNKWYIYFKNDESGKVALYLASAEIADQKAAYWESDWGEHANWVNENQVIIPPLSTRNFAVLLNPFTGEWKKLEPLFPSGLNFTFPHYYYNSTLTRAVYVSGDHYILWDSSTNADIVTKLTYAPYIEPKWSPDGNFVAMILEYGNLDTFIFQDKLVILDQKGDETNLTKFFEDYKENITIQIGSFRWSPDNRYIAFSLRTGVALDKDSPSTLIVADLITKEIYDYCFPINTYSSINWSPDSRKLIVEAHNPRISVEENRAILVDITSNWSAYIGDGFTPIGWMLKP